MTILERRANFYGKTVDWLIDAMDNHMDEGLKVTEAYEVYKMDQGYYWKGINHQGWVKRENDGR